MPDDPDPHVYRVIRTPNTVISINGTLSEVDRIYRATNKALLACGYTIPKPSENPWQGFAPPSDSVDHLHRRIADLEAALEASESYEVLQMLRRTFKQVEIERDQFRQAFIDLDQQVQESIKTLTDETITDNLRIAIVWDKLA